MITLTWINLFIIILFVYRVSDLLADVSQGGPYDILAEVRHMVGVRFDEQSVPYGINTWARGLLCVYCNSFWVALFAAIVYYLAGNWAIAVMLPFALSGAAIILWRRT